MKIAVWIVGIFLFVACSRDQTIRFALFSDTHIAENTSGAEDLRMAVEDVNALGNLDFVLVSGDITDMNIGNNLRVAKRILDSLLVPYYIIPGNHDTKWSASAGANFRHLWSDDKFVFDAGKYRFIGFHQDRFYAWMTVIFPVKISTGCKILCVIQAGTNLLYW